jgi:Leucine-rich repeat (LRR) protein
MEITTHTCEATQSYSVELYADNISRLPLLQTLHLENNQLTALPEAVGHCPSLIKLICSTNLLQALPMTMNNLKKIQRLDFANNMIKKVPAVMGQLKALKEFNLRYNNLEPQFQAAADEGLSKFLTFLKQEEEREEAEARERMRPIGTQVFFTLLCSVFLLTAVVPLPFGSL